MIVMITSKVVPVLVFLNTFTFYGVSLAGFFVRFL